MDPTVQTALSVQLATIEPKWRHALRVWWSWQWRVFIAGFLLTLFAHFWLGMMGGLMGLRAVGLALSTQVVDTIIMALVGLYFWKDVLDRDYGQFRVCIVPNDSMLRAESEREQGTTPAENLI